MPVIFFKINFIVLLLFHQILAENLKSLLENESCCGPLLQDLSKEITYDINYGCHLDVCNPNLVKTISVVNISFSKTAQLSSPFMSDSDELEEDREGRSPGHNSVSRHWIWPVIEHPSIQMSINSHEHEGLNINWSGLLGVTDLDKSISFDTNPIFSSTLMMYRLIEYDDVSDKGYFDASSLMNDSFFETANTEVKFKMYDLRDFTWTRSVLSGGDKVRGSESNETPERENVRDKINSQNNLIISFVGTEKKTTEKDSKHFRDSNDSAKSKPIFQPLSDGGSINITFAGYAHNGFGLSLPHLSHSRATNQMDIQLQNLTSSFNHSRFAVQFAVVVSPTSEGGGGGKLFPSRRHDTKILDDEHTPGIFDIHELIFEGVSEDLQSYIQWRPVAYSTADRDVSKASHPNVSSPFPFENKSQNMNGPQCLLCMSNDTILTALYGNRNLFHPTDGVKTSHVIDSNNVSLATFFVSFGSPKDGFFKSTNYSAWTLTFGSGVPIHNGLSSTVIIIMSIMFVTILVAIALALISYFYKKMQIKQVDEILESAASTTVGNNVATHSAYIERGFLNVRNMNTTDLRTTKREETKDLENEGESNETPSSSSDTAQLIVNT